GRQDEALKLHEAALALREARFGPNHPETLRSKWAVAGCRIHAFARAKDVAGCRATTEMCEKLNPTDPNSLYSTACYHAITATVLQAKTEVPDAASQATAEADLAMAWLQKAIAAGYQDATNIQTDKDLDTLRDRVDFQKLLADLKTGK